MSEIVKAYIGIDPGLDGGLAFWVPRENLITATVIPLRVAGTSQKGADKSEVDVVACMQWIGAQYKPTIMQTLVTTAVIEKVSAMPHQGVCSMFNFGMTFGKLTGMLEIMAAASVSKDGVGTFGALRVTPQTWKKLVLAGTQHGKGDAIAHVKNRFPHVNLLPTPRCRKPHDGMADAICMAEYAAQLGGL